MVAIKQLIQLFITVELLKQPGKSVWLYRRLRTEECLVLVYLIDSLGNQQRAALLRVVLLIRA